MGKERALEGSKSCREEPSNGSSAAEAGPTKLRNRPTPPSPGATLVMGFRIVSEISYFSGRVPAGGVATALNIEGDAEEKRLRVLFGEKQGLDKYKELSAMDRFQSSPGWLPLILSDQRVLIIHKN